MKELIKILSICVGIFLFISCSDKVDPMEFTDGKEIRYAGKVNDLVYFPGNNRVEVQFVLGPDPNVNKAIIYWNLREKSVEIDINRAALESDTVSYIFEEMPENTYSFEIFTFDVFGNKSVPEYLTAKSYGTKYISGLYDRNIVSYEAANLDGNIQINWGDSVMKSVGVKLKYEDINSIKKEVYVYNTDISTVLEAPDLGKAVTYQTLHIPEDGAIDTFTIAPVEVEFDKEKLILYLKKPYNVINVEGFDSPWGHSNKQNLWDEKWGRGYVGGSPWDDYTWADGAGWADFYTSQPDDFRDPTWLTFDVGTPVRLQKYRQHGYWPYYHTAPRVWELWAYAGEGEPTAATGWDNWVKIGEYDNTHLGAWNAPDQSARIAAYPLGEALEFNYDDVPLARYYRAKCLKNWNWNDEKPKEEQNNGVNISLTEVFFWAWAYVKN